MTLTGRTLWVALGGTFVLGVAAGTFAEGWRKAQGLPGTVSVDAGVSVTVDAGTSSKADCAAVVVPAAPERHWEAGPSALYGFTTQQVLWGGALGWSGGPFGVRVQVLKGPGDVYAGGALVWRW